MSNNANLFLQLVRDSSAYSSVMFCNTRLCWVYNENQKLRGVRRLLEERCWPHYNYHRAERLNNAPVSRTARVLTGVRSARQGRNRGTAVHRQLGYVAALGLDGARTFLRRHAQRMNPLVEQALQRFYKLGWRLIAADVPVYDEVLGIGSAIDLVCETKDDKRQLILIELKVGGDNYYDKPSGAMEAELADYDVPNSPINQAVIQLLAYKILFERNYAMLLPADAVKMCAVLFVGMSGIIVHELTERTTSTLTAPLGEALRNGALTANNKTAEQQKPTAAGKK